MEWAGSNSGEAMGAAIPDAHLNRYAQRICRAAQPHIAAAGLRHSRAAENSRRTPGQPAIQAVVGLTVVPRPSRMAQVPAISRIPLFLLFCNPAAYVVVVTEWFARTFEPQLMVCILKNQ